MFNFIGQTLGQYRILEQIGVGGMATVYKAYQPSVDRYVAIKILPQHLSQDEQFIKRFQREAHAIARLEHAHILPVFDYGESEGISYIAMRYISSGTLKNYMAKGNLPLSEISRIITQIGSALDYAHHQGVIHRDIKPANILLDEQNNTYLTDFGLARMLESSQHLTGSGVGVGTPAYMSPEQGKGEKSDHRSDIYSLGVILYEMVTGRVPFEAETPMAIVLKHINEPLPLPRVVAPGIPEAVEKVILKSLAKDPVHRYQSAGEMAEALALALRKVINMEAQPLPTYAIASSQPEKPLWQKRLGKLFFASGVVLAILLLTVFFSRFVKQGQIAEEKAATTPVMIKPVDAFETVPIMPSAVSASSIKTISLRILLTSSSDWAQVLVLPPSNVLKAKTIETGGTVTEAVMQDRRLQLNQLIDRALIGREVYIMQDLTLTGITEGEVIHFQMDKGAIGRVTIEVFNLVTGTPLLVERYVRGPNDPNGPDSFNVVVGLLVNANLPSTPTPIPIYKKPLEGKELFICQNITPPQFCVRDYKTGQMTQITHDLKFDMLNGIWSPDGQQILISAGSDFYNNPAKHPDHKLYLINADGSNLRQITFGDFHNQEIDWSPDGQWIAAYQDCQLWLIRSDGSESKPLVQSNECIAAPIWSPDSRKIAFMYLQDGYYEGIWIINKDGSNLREIYKFKTKPKHGGINWSPDGHQIYGFNMPDLPNYFLVNVDGSGEIQEIPESLYWWSPTFWPRWGGNPK